MNTITIDCGASYIKGALINKDGVVLKKQQKQAPAVCKNEDILASGWINTLYVIVKKMIEELAENVKETKLCISNEMHGFILAYENGTPYTDYISWQREFGAVRNESDGKSAVNILSQCEYETDILKSGMPLRAGLPSCNLFFLKRAGYLKNYNTEEKLFFYTLGDYIIRRFANLQPICHPSNAAATGLYYLENETWNYRLIEMISGKDMVFPEVGSREILINRAGIRYHIYPAIGDQQAALLGAGLMNSGELSFNLGTGAQVSVLADRPEFGTEYQIRPYFAGRYIKTIPHLPSGRALNVYIRFFEDVFKRFQIQIDQDTIWKVLIDSVKFRESNLICDMSFFENPITDHKMGSIQNIGEYDLSVENLMNGIFEQMAENFLWAANKIQPNENHVKKILFSGGIGRKIEMIRKRIVEHYSGDVMIQVAENETLIGLYKYGKE